jgi:hypothetical protein
MSPCTFLVTAVVNKPGYTIFGCIRDVYADKGVRGFYHGASAVAIRQMTNWASRSGFTEYIRNKAKIYKSGKVEGTRLTVLEESLCGIVGGALACWNHPIEVCRIEMQSRTVAKEPQLSIVGTLTHVVKTNGPLGLFKGMKSFDVSGMESCDAICAFCWMMDWPMRKRKEERMAERWL